MKIYKAKASETRIIIIPKPPPTIVGHSAPVTGIGIAVAVDEAFAVEVALALVVDVAVALLVEVAVAFVVDVLVAVAVALVVAVEVAVAVGTAQLVRFVVQDPPATGQQYCLDVDTV